MPPEVRLVDLKSRRAATCLVKLVRYLSRERPKTLIVDSGHFTMLVASDCKDDLRPECSGGSPSGEYLFGDLFAHASFKDRLIMRVSEAPDAIG